MEYQLSKTLEHVDGLSRLIAENAKPLEDMIISALKREMEVKNILCKVVWELPVTLDEIKQKAEKDVFIAKIKKQLKETKKEQNKELNMYLICNGIVMYGQRIVIRSVLEKCILKDVSFWISWYFKNEIFHEKFFYIGPEWTKISKRTVKYVEIIL